MTEQPQQHVAAMQAGKPSKPTLSGAFGSGAGRTEKTPLPAAFGSHAAMEVFRCTAADAKRISQPSAALSASSPAWGAGAAPGSARSSRCGALLFVGHVSETTGSISSQRVRSTGKSAAELPEGASMALRATGIQRGTPSCSTRILCKGRNANMLQGMLALVRNIRATLG
jgi:hypothetical protein